MDNNNYFTKIVNINQNPNAHKSIGQILDEMDLLKEKIIKNKSELINLQSEKKILLENTILEDTIKFNELNYELDRRERKRKSQKKINIIILCIIIIFTFLFLFLIFS